VPGLTCRWLKIMADDRLSRATQRGHSLSARMGLRPMDACCTRWMDGLGPNSSPAGEHSERHACATCHREYLVTFNCAQSGGTVTCNAVEAISIEP